MILFGAVILLASIHSMNLFGPSVDGLAGVAFGTLLIAMGVYLARR